MVLILSQASSRDSVFSSPCFGLVLGLITEVWGPGMVNGKEQGDDQRIKLYLPSEGYYTEVKTIGNQFIHFNNFSVNYKLFLLRF